MGRDARTALPDCQPARAAPDGSGLQSVQPSRMDDVELDADVQWHQQRAEQHDGGPIWQCHQPSADWTVDALRLLVWWGTNLPHELKTRQGKPEPCAAGFDGCCRDRARRSNTAVRGQSRRHGMRDISRRDFVALAAAGAAAAPFATTD